MEFTEGIKKILDGKNWNEIIRKISLQRWKRNICIQSIESLLDAGLDVNYVNKYGTTMLTYATECGDLEIVRFLVKKGADANVTDFNGTNSLHIAAQYFRKDILKYFLSLGISADSYDHDNCTALHYVTVERSDTSSASKDICQELIHILADHDADLNAVNQNGCSPMILAAKKSHRHIVELFIRLGANLKSCDPDHWSVLHFACREGWTDTVRTLVEGRFELDLDAVTSDGTTPAIIAANCNHKDIVSLLVESGADVKCKGLSLELIHCVCRRGWLDVLKLLVSKGADIHAEDFNGNTPLFKAAAFAKVRVVEHLIECGADVKGCNRNRWTLLHFACHLGCLDMVKLLVSKGCDINAKDAHGFTPAYLAGITFHLDIFVYLIENGADVKGCDGRGWTFMHYACFNGWVGVVIPLVSQGADVNAKTDLGETPMHHALYAPSPQRSWVIEYLIRNGAYFRLEDNGAMGHLKNDILQNIQLCTLAVMNKYNNYDLLKFWEIPQVPKMLLQVCNRVPQIEKLKISSMNGVAKDIENSVVHEIKNKGFCNVFSVKPMVLQWLCVLTLIKHLQR